MSAEFNAAWDLLKELQPAPNVTPSEVGKPEEELKWFEEMQRLKELYTPRGTKPRTPSDAPPQHREESSAPPEGFNFQQEDFPWETRPPVMKSWWGVLKSRTFRDQSGGFGEAGRAGDANQPFTDINVRQRVPLVGSAPRVDRNYEERSDVTTHPRYQEQAAMQRDMASDVEADEPFDEPETVDEFTAAHGNRNRIALEQMLMGSPKPRTLGEAVDGTQGR